MKTFNSVRLGDAPTSDDKLNVVLGQANKIALFGQVGDRSWLDDPSIKKLMQFTATYTSCKTRNCGKMPECTHYAEVAHWTRNCPELKHIPPDVIAFVAYGHDLVEILRDEYPEISPELIVKECWLGDENHKDFIIYALNQITDPPEKTGEERLLNQITRANEETSGLVRYIRYADKYCTYLRDFWCLERGQHPFDGAKEYLKNLELRNMVVQQLDIKEEYKLTFSELKQEIENILEKQMNSSPLRDFSNYAANITRRLFSSAGRTIWPFFRNAFNVLMP